MEHISPVILLGLLMFLGAIVLYSYYDRSEKNQYTKFFEQQALRRNGKVLPPNNDQLAILYFPDLDTELSVFMTEAGLSSPPSTHFFADLNKDTDYKFQVYKEQDFDQLKETFEAQDIRLCNDAFDKEFKIRGNNEILVNWMFTEDLQNQLLKCKEHSPILEFDSHKFSLSVPFFIMDEKIFDLLVETTECFVTKLKQIEQ